MDSLFGFFFGLLKKYVYAVIMMIFNWFTGSWKDRGGDEGKKYMTSGIKGFGVFSWVELL